MPLTATDSTYSHIMAVDASRVRPKGDWKKCCKVNRLGVRFVRHPLRHFLASAER
jgi:hypothetical protein